ncbi:uncharacterized protein LOC142588150 [Dermacentor variabilis]|uniref:uncharacterized protein LOC142588150 n=1 Tax=Dermacentor variabilis TaxID=34621 RepID=UPI003F5BBB11
MLASSVDDIDWRATQLDSISYLLQSRLYEAKKRRRSVEHVTKAARLCPFPAPMLSVDKARQLEENSRQQSQSATWKAFSKSRLTASNFDVAFTRDNWTEKGLHNLIKDRYLSRARVIQ